MQYPGRQDRRAEPFVTSITGMADLIAAELAQLSPGPLLLFCHSMGAAVAFETARRVEQAGRHLVGLVASARRAPSHHHAGTLHAGTDADLIAELRRLDGTATSLLADDDAVQMILPAVRNDYHAIETYRCPPDATVHCPITVLLGADDPSLTDPEASRWAAHTTTGYDLHTFPGGHFYLVPQRRQVTALLHEMSTAGRRVARRGHPGRGAPRRPVSNGNHSGLMWWSGWKW